MRFAFSLALLVSACSLGNPSSSQKTDIESVDNPSASEADGVQTIDADGDGILDSIDLEVVPRTDFSAPKTSYTPQKLGPSRPLLVTLTCTDDSGACASTYYSFDGSAPTLESQKYTAPLQVMVGATLKFFSVDAANNREAVQSVDFVIDEVAPQLLAGAPADEAMNVGLSDVLSLRFDEQVSASCALEPAAELGEVFDSAMHTLYLFPLAPLVAGQRYRWTCTGVSDLAGNAFAGTIDTHFTTSPPRSDFTAPSTTHSPQPTGPSQAFSLTLTCTDAQSGCATTHYELGGATATTGSPAFTGPISVSSSTSVSYFSVDVAGNVEAPRSAAFVVDLTAPTLSAQSPLADAVNVTLGTDLTLTFSEALDESTVSGSCVIDPPVSVSEIYDAGSRTLHLLPSAPLSPARVYTVSCAAGAPADVAGNTFAGVSFSFSTEAPPAIAFGDEGQAMIQTPEAVFAGNGDGAALWTTAAPGANQLWVSIYSAQTNTWSFARMVEPSISASPFLLDTLKGQVALFESGGDRFVFALYRARNAIYTARVSLDAPAAAPVVSLLSAVSAESVIGLAQHSPSELLAFTRSSAGVNAYVFDGVSTSFGSAVATGFQSAGAVGASQVVVTQSAFAVAATTNVAAGKSELRLAYLRDSGGGYAFDPAERLDAPSGSQQCNFFQLHGSKDHEHLLAIIGYNQELRARTLKAGTWDPLLSATPFRVDLGVDAAISTDAVHGFAGPNHFSAVWATKSSRAFARRYRESGWETIVQLDGASNPGHAVNGARVCASGDDLVALWPAPYDTSNALDDGRMHFRMATAAGGFSAMQTLGTPDLESGTAGNLSCFVDGNAVPHAAFVTLNGPSVTAFSPSAETAQTEILGTDPLGTGAARCLPGAGSELRCLYASGRAIAARQRTGAGTWLRDALSLQAPFVKGQVGPLVASTNARGEGLAAQWLRDGQVVRIRAHHFSASGVYEAHDLSSAFLADPLVQPTFALRPSADGFVVFSRISRYIPNATRVDRMRNGVFGESRSFAHSVDVDVVESRDVSASGELQMESGAFYVPAGSSPFFLTVFDNPVFLPVPVAVSGPNAQSYLGGVGAFGPSGEPLLLYGEISNDLDIDDNNIVRTWFVEWDGSAWSAPAELSLGYWSVATFVHTADSTVFALQDLGGALPQLIARRGGAFLSAVSLPVDETFSRLTASPARTLVETRADPESLGESRVYLRLFDGVDLSQAYDLGDNPSETNVVAEGDDFLLTTLDDGEAKVWRIGGAGPDAGTVLGAASATPVFVRDGSGFAVVYRNGSDLYVARRTGSLWRSVSLGAQPGTVQGAGLALIEDDAAGVRYRIVGEAVTP